MSILGFLSPKRRRVDRRRMTGRALYNRVAARTAALAESGELGLEDDFSLRFEVVVLFASGTLFQWRVSGRDDPDLAQAYWEEVFEGFDHSLRQRGVTDVRMAARMRKLLVHGTGRRKAYLTALESGDKNALRDAIGRNVLNDVPGSDPRVDRLLDELEQAARDAEAELGEP